MTGFGERTIRTESVRAAHIRDVYGSCVQLGISIRDEGLRRPITVWSDATLISGARRLRAAQLVGQQRIQAIFVDNIEDAAKRLHDDMQDAYLSRPYTWTEVCRLWGVLRRLDAPAAAVRAEVSRRRGVELRRLTMAGKRKPGRERSRTEDYALGVISAPFGMSEATAKRLWTVYSMANGLMETTDERRELAVTAMRSLDAGDGSISAAYERLIHDRPTLAARPRPKDQIESAAASRQSTAWTRSLPQMEGLVAGLVELGPPNAELAWDQVEPVRARLMAVRRDLEKIIRQMKETSKS